MVHTLNDSTDHTSVSIRKSFADKIDKGITGTSFKSRSDFVMYVVRRELERLEWSRVNNERY